MEASTFSSPPPDRILSIALRAVAIFGALEVAALAFYYVGRARTEYGAAHPKPAPRAGTTPAAAPPTTAPPITQTVAAPPASIQSSPSAAVLSAAERLLKDATLLREQGDT